MRRPPGSRSRWSAVSGPTHRARLSPIQAETVWSLEDGDLVERRGGRERRFPLQALKRLRRTAGGAVLTFPRARLAIPSTSYEGLRPEPRPESFEALMAALAAEAKLAPPPKRSGVFDAIVWIIVLMAIGAIALLVFAAASGAWRLGLALAARFVFVLILAAAVLPWLRRR